MGDEQHVRGRLIWYIRAGDLPHMSDDEKGPPRTCMINSFNSTTPFPCLRCWPSMVVPVVPFAGHLSPRAFLENSSSLRANALQMSPGASRLASGGGRTECKSSNGVTLILQGYANPSINTAVTEVSNWSNNHRHPRQLQRTRGAHWPRPRPWVPPGYMAGLRPCPGKRRPETAAAPVCMRRCRWRR